MITEEHLKHWLGEIQYQMTSIRKEIDKKKIKCDGIVVNGAFVSFEYLREKEANVTRLLACIVSDIKLDV